MDYCLGCSGWSYEGWKGHFYPKDLDKRYWLSYYSQIFDFVEIDSTFYRIPSSFMVNNWNKRTPDNFRFAVKFPKVVTHDKRLNNVQKDIEQFYDAMEPLYDKIQVFLLQLPPSLQIIEGLELIKNLRYTLDPSFRYAIEVRHHSWFNELFYNYLKERNYCLVWSQQDILVPPPILTTDFLYLRLIGDRSIDERDFGKIKKDRTKEMQLWTRIIKDIQKNEKNLQAVIVVANNHYAGFGPMTTKLFAEMMNLENKIKQFHILDYQKLNNEINDDKKKKNKNTTNKKPWAGKAIFHVDINSFYSSCEEIRNPSLKGKPHAVIMTDQDNNNITKGVVATCSYQAKKLGVQSAMSLYKALELCPTLILHAVDKKFYNEISETVMEILEGYSNTLEQASIDEAYLDCTDKISSISSTYNNLTTVEEYAQEIKKSIKEKCGGLLTSIGVAPTKSVAKIASDYEKPDGLTIVPVDELKDFLNRLEVERISGIGTKTQRILKKEMNINTIGELANKDVQILIGKFGKKIGTWMWQVANGEDKDPVIPRGDHVSLSNETTLENFTLDRQIIKQSLCELVDELFKRIKHNNYQFRTVGIKLVRTDFSIETREKSFMNYQYEKNNIESIIEELLNKFNLEKNISSESTTNSKKYRTENILPIRKVGLKVTNLISMSNNNVNKQSRQMTLSDYI
ncbi:MAG TPA: DNA polymerase IV [Nitrososphaeraceae archaeon]|nr:DNA polymerase IV [Nitrososphaeraceae archaeon]